MKRLLLILAVALGFALPSFAQQIVDVHQMGDKIVIEYDLSQPAEFVRLYVSTDGGTTYRGIEVQDKIDKIKQQLDN